MTSDLTIAAIIPLHNGAAFIREAVESVFIQSIQPSEFVIVDDGSTDNGPDIVAELQTTSGFRFLRKGRGGQSSARNYGVKHTTSSLIAFLDQDDVWSRDHLELLRDPFLTRPSVPLGWVYSDVDLVDPKGNLLNIGYLSRPEAPEEHPKRNLINCLKHNMMIWTSAALISREAFERVNGFDEDLIGYEDDDFWLRAFRAGFHNVFIPRSLARIRRHVNSSGRSPQMRVSRVKYAEKLLAEFPDDTQLGLLHTSRAIIPRFVSKELSDLNSALARGDKASISSHLSNLALFEPFCDEQFRAQIDRFRRQCLGGRFDSPADSSDAASVDSLQELRALRRCNALLEAQVAQLQRSWSWRITGPLRAASRLLRLILAERSKRAV